MTDLCNDECPICYKNYGDQPEGYFLCKNGIYNSYFESSCKHDICHQCCCQYVNSFVRGDIEVIRCPLCREDWTEWLLRAYDELLECNCDNESDNELENYETN